MKAVETEAEKQARQLAEHADELGGVLKDDLLIHSFMGCKACAERDETQRLEAGLSRTGLVVQCMKHGLIVHLSPEQLRRQMAKGPQCDCCPGGRHRS